MGQDYRIGDDLDFDDDNNLGQGAAGFVRVVNGGVANEDDSGDNIILEEETERGDIYGGSKIVQETDTGTGDITDIFLSAGGNGYKELPPVSITSATGSGGKVLAYGNGVGKINSLKTVEHGKGYEASPAPTLTFVQNFLCVDRTGTFLADNTFTTSGGVSGKIISLDTNNNVLKLKEVSGTININDTITSQTGGTAKIKRFSLASATVNVVPVTDTDGEFINDDGKLSESTMKIQDSLYYQDFSYVIKVGQSINAWRDAFKKTMHTAGFILQDKLTLQVD